MPVNRKVEKENLLFATRFGINPPMLLFNTDTGLKITRKIKSVYLIDWEYSGMFDPLWDIAMLFLSFELQEEAQLFFLTQYLERKPSAEELQRILMHTIFQDYLWSLWGYAKKALGDDVGWDTMKRIKRAMENVTLYKKNYEQEIVG